jgi:hypothetical protein
MSNPNHYPEAFEEEVERRRTDALSRIKRIPIAGLIWGPAPAAGTPVAAARLLLRDALLSDGHLARFSEDLLDPSSSLSVFTQQVAQAEAYDIVFSIPDSPGSIAEIHDFARIPWLSPKIVAFLNIDWNDGYANKSLIQLQSIATCQVQLYPPTGLPQCIIEPSMKLVRRLQELYYVAGRRY